MPKNLNKNQIYNRNLNGKLFLPLMVIKIPGLPGDAVKIQPDDSRLVGDATQGLTNSFIINKAC